MMSMKSISSSFTKVHFYHRPQTNDKIGFSKKLKRTDENKVCGVAVYESMRVSPSSRRRDFSVFKSIHCGKRFQMYAFRVTLNTV